MVCIALHCLFQPLDWQWLSTCVLLHYATCSGLPASQRGAVLDSFVGWCLYSEQLQREELRELCVHALARHVTAAQSRWARLLATCAAKQISHWYDHCCLYLSNPTPCAVPHASPACPDCPSLFHQAAPSRCRGNKAVPVHVAGCLLLLCCLHSGPPGPH